ncbi:MAG: DUF4173 domain-containing protein [Candidatus Peribacteraceae bacterium]|nr:DUF4173 domain-containing protein [Candidatus Peribacteraceae bacterium]
MFFALFTFLAIVAFLSLPVIFIYAFLKRRAVFPATEKQPVVFPKLLPYSLLGILLAFNLFGYPLNAGIGLGIFGALLQAGIVLCMDKKQRTPGVLFLALCGVIVSILLGVRGNDFLFVFNSISAAFVIILLFLVQSVDTIQWRGLWMVTMIGRYISGIFDHIPHILSLSKNMKNSQGGMLISVLKTVVLTFIALFFFSALLSQADPVFKHVIDEISKEVVPRFGYSLLIAIVLTIVLTMRFVVTQSDDSHAFRFLKFHELFFPTLSIVVLFAIFLVIQAKYLFGSHENIQIYNLTYSDYVRKGFIELLTASFFGGLLSYIVILRARSLETITRKRELTAVNVLLIIELFLMLASALKRDYLYMDTYGITRVRIIGEAFIWWLAALFVLLFVFAVYKRVREEKFFAGLGIVSAIAVIGLNTINMDAMIAKAQPPNGRVKDLYYISLLSTDASSQWRNLILDAQKRYQSVLESKKMDDAAKTELAAVKLAMRNIATRISDLHEMNNPSVTWQQWNMADQTALRMVEQNPKLFKELPKCLVEDIQLYQVRSQLSLQDQTATIQYESKYPFVFSAPRYEYSEEVLDNINRDYYFLKIGVNVPYDEKGNAIPPDVKTLPQATGCRDLVVQ